VARRASMVALEDRSPADLDQRLTTQTERVSSANSPDILPPAGQGTTSYSFTRPDCSCFDAEVRNPCGKGRSRKREMGPEHGRTRTPGRGSITETRKGGSTERDSLFLGNQRALPSGVFRELHSAALHSVPETPELSFVHKRWLRRYRRFPQHSEEKTAVFTLTARPFAAILHIRWSLQP